MTTFTRELRKAPEAVQRKVAKSMRDYARESGWAGPLW
jgi:hypothetical protein